jgi:hypothetical protein
LDTTGTEVRVQPKRKEKKRPRNSARQFVKKRKGYGHANKETQTFDGRAGSGQCVNYNKEAGVWKWRVTI